MWRYIAIYVTAIVKDGAAQPVADEGQLHRKAQFLVENQERQTADREARAGIARASCIQAETTKGSRAAGKKPFGQWNDLRGDGRSGGAAICRATFRRAAFRGLTKRLFKAKTRSPREDESASESMKRGVLKKSAKKACAGTQ